MVVTTDRVALNARFDMLFSGPMKKYVKGKGGGEYIRNLVLRDILNELQNENNGKPPATVDIETIINIYDAEIERLRSQVA